MLKDVSAESILRASKSVTSSVKLLRDLIGTRNDYSIHVTTIVRESASLKQAYIPSLEYGVWVGNPDGTLIFSYGHSELYDMLIHAKELLEKSHMGDKGEDNG